MDIVSTILRELLGLFIDDGSFALGIVAWVVATAIGLRLGVNPVVATGALFLGLAALLAENVWRSTRLKQHRAASPPAR